MLYGRDAERSVVTALLDAARDSRSGVLVLRGQAGAGKSALLQDAVEQASDLQVLEARGIESEAELAFAGLHQLLRPILGQVDGLPGPRATALRAAFGLEQGRVEDRFLVSVAALLAEHAAVPVAPQVRDRLVERTGGNPLALVELPSVLTSDQLSGVQPLPLPLPLTDGVENAFLERVRRLPDDAQALLLIAAAEDTGRQATVTAAAATLGAGVAALDAAEAAGLVRVRAGAIAFRHPLVRSA